MSQYRKVSEHYRFRLLSGLFLFSMHKIPNIFKGKELLIRFCTKYRTHLTSSQHLRISGFAAVMRSPSDCRLKHRRKR